jgi:alpha-L-fucosidase 2
MKEWKLRYASPALRWQQGLPIGNGRIGAVLLGGGESDLWSMNEVTYWSGQPERTPGRSEGKADLERVRQHFFRGEYTQGEKLAEALYQSEERNFGTHLQLCDIQLEFMCGCPGKTVRELDLERALVLHESHMPDNVIAREMFASHVDQVVAARISSRQAGRLSFTLSLAGKTDVFEVRPDGEAALAFQGQAVESMHSDGTCGVHARGVIRAVVQGGTVKAAGPTLVVEQADEAFLYFAVNTDYGQTNGDWMREAESQVNRAAAKGYEQLKADHIADYRKLYARVELELGDSDRESLPTDARIRNLRGGRHEDPQLHALFFQYGRYLMISGSREDSPLPMNLQGIWNDGEANRMAWSCDYHLDVNTEMNYYPTEAVHLAECHLPLMRYIERLAQAGRASARDFYGCEGWVAHVFSNAWGFTAPGWHYSWGLNVTGGLWLAMQMKEHYEYGLDQRFLAEQAYPVLKEAALFFLDYMTVHPVYGWLVTGPSNSPENSFYVDGNTQKPHHLSMGPTLDQTLVRDLFVFCLEAAEKLRVDEELRDKLRQAIGKLPPLQVGNKGQLREWLEDYEEAQPDHRHFAHLYGLYPGNQIVPNRTPELCAAARKTLEMRSSRVSLEDVEFTLAAFAASFARLHDGDEALRHLNYLIGELCFDNLLTYSKPGIAGAETCIFVIDGNFGGTAAIAEMLLQSHAGEIHLLPALPASWHTGKAKGLRARGNVEVDMSWKDGVLTEATIRAFKDVRSAIRYGNRVVPIELEAGEAFAFAAS